LKLLSELEMGKEYALVGSSFQGGALVRYVLGDSVKVLSLSEEGIGLKLPQLAVASRIDDVIDIASFTRLTEKTIWTAVEGAGIPYIDWVVAKEYAEDRPVLHLYIEMKGTGHDEQQVRDLVHESLKRVDENYRNLEVMLGIRPLTVTFFSHGTFLRYLQERQAAGIDIAHSKPVHMNPRSDVLARLLSMSSLRI
jgi:hypothetical protein